MQLHRKWEVERNRSAHLDVLELLLLCSPTIEGIRLGSNLRERKSWPSTANLIQDGLQKTLHPLVPQLMIFLDLRNLILNLSEGHDLVDLRSDSNNTGERSVGILSPKGREW